ncbi:MAG: thiol-disulfide isomerase/thioredoxin [Myxococcota bacterium]|jgi:thiol-disulfide isomerase/thioredoxin
MIADFTLPNCDKLPITISEQLGDKRLLLLEFGAGWCVACRDNQPHLKELVERFGDCIEVLTILSEEGVGMPPTSQFCAKWRDGCAERGCGVLPFQILTDPLKQTTKRHRDGSAIPVTVLTDRCGKVLFKAVGESPDLDDLVEAACSN